MIDHPDREALQNEIHARPRQAIAAPHRVSHIALLRRRASDARRTPIDASDPLAVLCASRGLPAPSPAETHFLADFGTFRLKRERHGEFDGYTIDADGCDALAPFARPALDALPRDWLDSLPGERIAAVHLAILPADAFVAQTSHEAEAGLVAHRFDGNELCGASVAEGDARVYTDFRAHPDGFTRMLLLDVSMDATRTGREVQRLIEIDVYRMMAMLAFPLARTTAAELDSIEGALGALVARLEQAPVSEEPELLRELTRLAATVERLAATVGFRFGAARAYHALVRQRGIDLRMGRLASLQTPIAFLERRFDPAMAFCESVGRRIEAAAERVTRASALLRTRVDIERERHNQELLSAMNRRAQLQLKLQQTVEGLSVAAITYYAVGLAGYLFKAMRAGGWPIDVDVATGVSVIPIAIAVALGIRHIREGLKRRLDAGPARAHLD